MDELIAGIDRQSLAEAGGCQSGVTAIRRQPVQSHRVRDQRRRNPVGPHTATGPISNPWDFRGILDNRRSSSAQAREGRRFPLGSRQLQACCSGRPRPKRGDRLDLVPPRARPQCRRSVSFQRQRVGRSLVVDPPTQEVRPRILEGAFDRKVDPAQALDGLDEIVIRERDPVAWVGVERDRDPDGAGNVAEAGEASAQTEACLDQV